MPSLSVVMSDVLQMDYTKLAELRGGPLSVIGNLPYHITSQASDATCLSNIHSGAVLVTMVCVRVLLLLLENVL